MLRICAVLVAGATALQAPRQPLSTAPSWLQAATLEQPPASTTKDLLPRERYVASNRFKTRGGKAAAKFEARWANRKSRLAELEGFRYFSLFREVPVEDVVGPALALPEAHVRAVLDGVQEGEDAALNLRGDVYVFWPLLESVKRTSPYIGRGGRKARTVEFTCEGKNCSRFFPTL